MAPHTFRYDKPGHVSWAARMGRAAVYSTLVFVVCLACVNMVRGHGSPRAERMGATESTTAQKMSGLAAVSAPPGFYALSARDIDGKDISMSKFQGDVLYIANVATY